MNKIKTNVVIDKVQPIVNNELVEGENSNFTPVVEPVVETVVEHSDNDNDTDSKFSIYSFIYDDVERPIKNATIFKVERVPVYATNDEGIKVALKGIINGIDYDRKGTCFVYTTKSRDKAVCTIPYAFLLNQAEKLGIEKALIRIAGSKCKIQFHNIDDALYNGDIVEKENYYCSAFSIDFCEVMFITALALKSDKGIVIPSMQIEQEINDYESI